MDKDKLIRQLFIGKVSEIIGQEKTLELLREAKTAIESPEPQLPLGDVIRWVCDYCDNYNVITHNVNVDICQKCNNKA